MRKAKLGNLFLSCFGEKKYNFLSFRNFFYVQKFLQALKIVKMQISDFKHPQKFLHPKKFSGWKEITFFFIKTEIKIFAQFNFAVDRFLPFLSQIWSNFILRLEKYGNFFFKFWGIFRVRRIFCTPKNFLVRKITFFLRKNKQFFAQFVFTLDSLLSFGSQI